METRHTENHWVFILEDGSKHSFGKSLTEEEALNLLNNPIVPEIPGIPCGLGFELGVQDSDQKMFTADVTGFQIKLLRGTAQLSDNVTITDKNGMLHTVTIGEYLDALDIYHSALRSAWEQLVGA